MKQSQTGTLNRKIYSKRMIKFLKVSDSSSHTGKVNEKSKKNIQITPDTNVILKHYKPVFFS